ncbi:MAG: response regulator transcription factor [Chloroflexi bacterium]|nr:response regulator transcription factor [Chloroflexota bacterium]
MVTALSVSEADHDRRSGNVEDRRRSVSSGGVRRVLVADRHPIVRLGLRTSLDQSQEFRVVAETDNGEDAIALGRRLQPDIVVLDVKLAGPRTGIDVARALRAASTNMRILVLSGYAQESYVRLMIDAGVDGYVLKDSPPLDIVDSIRTVLTTRQVFSGSLKNALAHDQGQVDTNRLTRRQLDVLQRLAEGNLNDEIARSLGISVKAVQIHLSGIYSRLGARTRTEAVVMAAKRGIVAISN